MGNFTDTHCHLNLNLFKDDLPEVMERARQAGVSRILVPGIDLETSRRAVALSEQYSEIYAAVGVHPNDALTWNLNSLSELKELVQHPRVLAVGEIGLDFYRQHSPHPLQKDVFSTQLDLAACAGKPVILHNRESFTELWDILSGWTKGLRQAGSPLADRPGIWHSFDGSLASANLVIDQGFYLGIGGPVTFNNAKERQAVASFLTLNRLLTETDAPYQTPHPNRGRRNEPAYVIRVAEKIAGLQNRSLEEVTGILWRNSEIILGWRINA